MSSYFSYSYHQARQRFLAAAQTLNLLVDSHVLPGYSGAANEVLATDTVLFNAEGARSLLVLSSGVHGIEGFCGSACQLAFLNDDDLQRRARDAHVAVLLVHAVNPYGFSHLRRTNEDNIDINRNCLDFSHVLRDNPAYSAIREHLIPPVWPETPDNAAWIADYIACHGAQAYQSAATSGQYTDPDGLFYGGTAPAWSNLTVRRILRETGAGFNDIGWIDFHTGLGPYGHGEKLYAGRPGTDELSRARDWWGGDVVAPFEGTSVSEVVSGPIAGAIYSECPHARSTSLALEYGTVPFSGILDALRGDQWLTRHRDTSEAQRALLKQQIRCAFYRDEDPWRGMVLGQARVAVLQALMGLGRGR